ncbi:hypothetical protein NLJ89_g12403 [Agrocybe chaxingu]|uniref:Uncharacterized protein n=1 Tax=Agrocybe chaxingu TaxID=84603 RepID=A0A9W8MNI6_9AGAR|nr:hypothetical protein NLJ89_g12403 [Agrocybe chaxingu]
MRSLCELAPPEREAILAHLHSLKDAGEEAMRSFDLSLPGRPPLFVKRSDDIVSRPVPNTSSTFVPSPTDQPLGSPKSSTFAPQQRAPSWLWRKSTHPRCGTAASQKTSA